MASGAIVKSGQQKGNGKGQCQHDKNHNGRQSFMTAEGEIVDIGPCLQDHHIQDIHHSIDCGGDDAVKAFPDCELPMGDEPDKIYTSKHWIQKMKEQVVSLEQGKIPSSRKCHPRGQKQCYCSKCNAHGDGGSQNEKTPRAGKFFFAAEQKDDHQDAAQRHQDITVHGIKDQILRSMEPEQLRVYLSCGEKIQNKDNDRGNGQIAVDD